MSISIKSESLLDSMKKNNKNVRNDRMEQLYASLKRKDEAYVERLRDEVAKIEQEIREHNDFGASSTVSLTVEKIDPDEWVERDNELYVDLRDAMIRLDVAEKRHKAKFSSEANNGESVMTFEN